MADGVDIDRDDPNAATRLLWGQLVEPFAVRDGARALFGLPLGIYRQLAGALIATSNEAETLLEAMPELLRGLSITTVQTAVHCQGELRGPVLWAETMAARAGTAGANDVFVCLTAERAYDTPQNRVLVRALSTLRHAATDADPVARQAYDDEVLLRARINGDEARRYLDHRTLRDVSRKRPSRREFSKTTSGRRSQDYQPAIDLIELAKNPAGLRHLLAFSDARTAWQHWVIVTLAGRLKAKGVNLGAFRATPNGDLRAGHLTYRHPKTAMGEGNPLHGILLERMLIDVPDPIDAPDRDVAAEQLERRAQGRVPVLVRSTGDVDHAVDLALAAIA